MNIFYGTSNTKTIMKFNISYISIS